MQKLPTTKPRHSDTRYSSYRHLRQKRHLGSEGWSNKVNPVCTGWRVRERWGSSERGGETQRHRERQRGREVRVGGRARRKGGEQSLFTYRFTQDAQPWELSKPKVLTGYGLQCGEIPSFTPCWWELETGQPHGKTARHFTKDSHCVTQHCAPLPGTQMNRKLMSLQHLGPDVDSSFINIHWSLESNLNH